MLLITAPIRPGAAEPSETSDSVSLGPWARHRVQKTFGLPPRQPEHEPQRQDYFDGDIRVTPLAI